MYITIATYKGDVKEEHKNLPIYPTDDGYVVEEKGVILLEIGEACRLQQLRFSNESDLLRIVITDTISGNVKILTK